ncbi:MULTISPECIES: homoprotocatechuate degradation operon regulator HpaR [Mameliella]|uniref:Bacterial regulatory protein, MarR family n=1 Tax=Mameliella alba TaxID=561184 RepID=A0A0B3SVD2_9RHOB|nr:MULTISPECIES: homoprotocatechuate degradation operon regulator HpaR [Mameliella]MBV6635517.1 homoprotocatechuate degradation operon regulator HpaR [Mameliella sp.]MCR9273320.1 homoprotocatechuate degradation operon regulator HpaR [Paracoccaceae bacterium]KHQ54404.1 Bacterial regulatory protein, MarR family [Mameliella alba]MBY6118440.1 homoprotocatechuate degradation operon regulator HpaR [Mameliella alba]OWV43291.1 homoprotocatechuate degradation operon regulator, HpaR [Mameliella alba]
MTRSRDDFPLSATQRTLPIALLRAREAVMERFRPMLRDIDVTEQQWRVLRVVQEAEEIDATQLARAACVLAPSLTRILKSLESRGLITQGRDKNDRRRTLVRLTEAGDALLHEAGLVSAKIYAEIEAKLSAERIADLLDALERMTDDLTRQDDAGNGD